MELSSRPICIGALLGGAAIWALSVHVTGAVEPWDAQSPYYLMALTVLGLVLGLISSRYAALVPFAVGLWLGQVGYEVLFLPAGPLFWLGLAFLAVYLVPAVLSGAASILVRRIFSRRTPSSDAQGT